MYNSQYINSQKQCVDSIRTGRRIFVGRYPILEVDRELVRRNGAIIRELCLSGGIEPAAVVKGYNALDIITEPIVEAGYKTLASSRIPHLVAIRERKYPVDTMLLRIPMASETSDVVRFADISLNSELETIDLLNRTARNMGVKHKVILMRDLGDLREGIFDRERFVETACRIESDFPGIVLHGVGTNLSCYGSVMPTKENLSQLAGDAREIEREIGRKLAVVSGGGSTSIPLLAHGDMPKGINHLRVGEATILSHDLVSFYGCPIPGHTNEALRLKAQIVEIGEKPTHPIGVLAVNCFGEAPIYDDRGIRRRAILAIGAYDVGDPCKLVPVDNGIKVLGSSSDHTIIDIHDSREAYKLGDPVAFTLCYQNMLFATSNPLILKEKVRIKK